MKFFYSLLISSFIITSSSFADYIVTQIEPRDIQIITSNDPVVGIAHENGSIYLIKDGQIVQEFKPKYSPLQKFWYGIKWCILMRLGLCLLPFKKDTSDIIAIIYGTACAASLE